jgi:hypothetical protein
MQGDEDEVRGSKERQSQIISRMCFLLHMCVKCVSSTGSKLAAAISRADCCDGELDVCWLPSGDAFYGQMLILIMMLWFCS